MREIKFRAVIPERNATIYFDLQDFATPSRMRLFSFREILLPWLAQGNKPDEYTGLKDKKRVEIYEGDIVHIAGSPQEDNKVEYYEGIYLLLPHGLHLTDWYRFVKVIGNIYESPELLKGGD